MAKWRVAAPAHPLPHLLDIEIGRAPLGWGQTPGARLAEPSGEAKLVGSNGGEGGTRTHTPEGTGS